MRTSSLRIVVTGFIAQYPLGGMAWHYLQYVLGLDRLGHDVYYLEDTGRQTYRPVDRRPGADCSFSVEYLKNVMSRSGSPTDGRSAVRPTGAGSACPTRNEMQ